MPASTKKKTPINTRFLGVSYILLDSKMNMVQYTITNFLYHHLLNQSLYH